MKLRTFRWFLPILFIALFSGQRPASEERVALEKVSRELKSIWPPDECAAYITRNSGFPMVSLACVGNFSKTERALSLDVLFKSGFALKDESYQLNPDSGLYLYKTEHPLGSGNFVFFKFYFRGATVLWPKTPVPQNQFALVVRNLKSISELIQWQGLGIPISYTVQPFFDSSKDLATKVREYQQEIWLELLLESSKMVGNDLNVLTVKQAMNPSELVSYLKKSLSYVPQPSGITHAYGDEFAEHVYVMRTLLREVKSLSGNTYYLDSEPTSNSVGFQTAKIMNLKAYYPDFDLSEYKAEQVKKLWQKITAQSQRNNAVVVQVSANSHEVYKALKELIKDESMKLRFRGLTEIIY